MSLPPAPSELPVVPVIAGQRLVTGDHVCRAVQATLTQHLPAWVAQVPGLVMVREWLQLPSRDAVLGAQLPVAAISSPGWSAPPVRHPRSWEATWRVEVAVYDRGSDHGDTQTRARTWAGLVRATLAQHPSLDGLASALTVLGEDLAVVPTREAARTFGACAVTCDVTVQDVTPRGAPTGQVDAGAPRVQTVVSPVTVRPVP